MRSQDMGNGFGPPTHINEKTQREIPHLTGDDLAGMGRILGY
jgi:hypothetical protein